MLLHVVRGPNSFEARRTVDGVLRRTYREACQKLDLLEHDQHWDKTLQEAALSSSAAQLRTLFAIILTTCNPSDPVRLWETYKEPMSEDILHSVQRANPTLEIAFTPAVFNLALIRLEDRCLLMSGKQLSQLGLTSPERAQGDSLNADYLRETNYDLQTLEAFIESNLPLLNTDQKIAFDFVMGQIRRNERNGAITFLDAPGGTGKTFLTNLILAEVRKQRNIALAVASSEIAATLMEGGRTAHSAFKLPLDIPRQENLTCKISHQQQLFNGRNSCASLRRLQTDTPSHATSYLC